MHHTQRLCLASDLPPVSPRNLQDEGNAKVLYRDCKHPKEVIPELWPELIQTL